VIFFLGKKESFLLDVSLWGKDTRYREFSIRGLVLCIFNDISGRGAVFHRFSIQIKAEK